MVEKVLNFFNKWGDKKHPIVPIPKTKQTLAQEKLWAATFVNKMKLEKFTLNKKLKVEDLNFVYIDSRNWKKFLNCYDIRVGLDALNQNSRANYSEPFFRFFDNKYGTLKQVPEHPCLMYTIPKGKNMYEVGFITITSKNQEVLDFGSQLVDIFKVEEKSFTKYQGLIGAVYTVNWRKDELDNFVMFFNKKDIEKIGGYENAEMIKKKAADFINKEKFVQFKADDKDYKSISIEFLKMVDFVEGQRKSVILYKDKNSSNEFFAIEKENKELIPSDYANSIPEE